MTRAIKLSQIVFWIIKKINHEITKFETYENGAVYFVISSLRDFVI